MNNPHCSAENCGIDATLSFTSRGERVNCCWMHYDKKYAKEAAQFVGKLGLPDNEAKIAWCKDRIARIGKSEPSKILLRWESLLNDPESSPFQKRLAAEAIDRLNRAPQREPGEDG